MRNIWIITKRELYRFFFSPIAYIVYSLFFFIAGYFFFIILVDFAQATTSYQGGVEHTNIFRAFWMNISVIFLFLLPAITMPLFSEEKRSGTLEILLTKPITDVEVVLGKFFAALLQFGIMIAETLLFLFILSIIGKPDFGWVACMYLGVILLGSSFLSLGILASSLTNNQIVAVVFGFVFLLVFWLMQFFAETVTGLQGFLTYLSLMSHFESFMKGLLDAKDILFYLSFTGFTLFLTTRIIESRKWR